MSEVSNSVIKQIRAKYKELFSAEKRVAEYILETPQALITMNISELARESGSSEATVVRMCKHVGYQGYHQMRLIMSHDLGKTQRTYDDGEILSTTQNLFSASAARVAALAERIDMELLVKTARILRSSRLVFVVAAGNTTPVANDLGFRLERCGIPCSYSVLPEQYLNHVGLGTSEDAIIAISRSGVSKPVVQAMNLARKNHMKTIVITAEKDTQLAEGADCILQIVDKKQKTTVAELDTHLLEFAVSDAILHVIRNFDRYVNESEAEKKRSDDMDDIELLLSEYKL